MKADKQARRVREQDCQASFDLVLTKLFPGWSRRQLKLLLRTNKVRINGQIARRTSVARVGDLVQLQVQAEHEAAPLDIIHETDNFIYLNKPSGVHVVAKYPGQRGTIASALHEHYPHCAQASSDPRDGGAIHRLDALTSGVLAVAKHAKAYQAGRQAMGHGGIQKQYLAALGCFARVRDARMRIVPASEHPPPDPAVQTLLKAHFPGWTAAHHQDALRIHAPLGRAHTPQAVAISPRGRPCASSLRIIAHRPTPRLTRLALLTLHTGMRHQLRVHMACMGHPIAHDPIYGHSTITQHRLALHAWRLDLGDTDPGCGPITAQVASDFVKASEAGSP